VLITWQRYDRDGRTAGGRDLDGALAPTPDGQCLWIRLFEPDEAELAAIDARLGLPQLAMEDAMHAHQRPKLERYGDELFTVLKPATYHDDDDRVELGELHEFAGHDHVLTVRHGPLGALDTVVDRLADEPALLRHGPMAILYAVADLVVDGYEPVVQGLEADIEEIELAVFDDEEQPPTERMYGLMRQVVDFHRATAALQRPMDDLARGTAGAVDPDLQPMFRDVADHVRQVSERLEALRQLLDSALQANLALIGLQENRDQRKISSWAAVGLVPTIIGGMWGMNVGVPFEGQLAGFGLVVVVMASASTLVWWRLHRNGWL
jgi:magnesium transporter